MLCDEPLGVPFGGVKCSSEWCGEPVACVGVSESEPRRFDSAAVVWSGLVRDMVCGEERGKRMHGATACARMRRGSDKPCHAARVRLTQNAP